MGDRGLHWWALRAPVSRTLTLLLLLLLLVVQLQMVTVCCLVQMRGYTGRGAWQGLSLWLLLKQQQQTTPAAVLLLLA
jgi:hypothetical protein